MFAVLLGLGKTFKVTKSNLQLNPTRATKPYHQCHVYEFFECLQGW